MTRTALVVWLGRLTVLPPVTSTRYAVAPADAVQLTSTSASGGASAAGRAARPIGAARRVSASGADGMLGIDWSPPVATIVTT